MFKFLNKDLYCCIFLNTEDSDSTYVTKIKTYNSPLYMNSYTFFFNLDGHKNWDFMGEIWWYKTEIECLQWIKFNWDQSINFGKRDRDKCFKTYSNSIDMFNKKNYLIDLFVHKDFTKPPLSIYSFDKDKLKKYEMKNGDVPNENPHKYIK